MPICAETSPSCSNLKRLAAEYGRIYAAANTAPCITALRHARSIEGWMPNSPATCVILDPERSLFF
jgi:hypothetical protein